MSVSTSKLAYQDCFDLFDQALEEAEGIKVKVESMDKAVHLRMRMHQARKLDREANHETYDPGDPMYGRSEYDRLTFRIRRESDATAWVHLTKIATRILEVKSLSDGNQKPEPIKPREAITIMEQVAPAQVEPLKDFVRRI